MAMWYRYILLWIMQQFPFVYWFSSVDNKNIEFTIWECIISRRKKLSGLKKPIIILRQTYEKSSRRAWYVYNTSCGGLSFFYVNTRVYVYFFSSTLLIWYFLFVNRSFVIFVHNIVYLYRLNGLLRRASNYLSGF